MGNACLCAAVVDSTVTSSTATKTTLPEFHPRNTTSCSPDHDALINDLVRRLNPSPKGQYHLLYKKGKQASTTTVSTARTTSTTTTIPASTTTTTTTTTSSTRLVQRRVKPDGVACIGTSGTHIYAIRYPKDAISEQRPVSEQCPVMTDNEPTTIVDLTKDPYVPASMIVPPRVPVTDWVCVSEELSIFVCDVGLSSMECDLLVQTTEQVCKGNYAAYTYAKQTLGCREFPTLAHDCWEVVHRVTHAIWMYSGSTKICHLDDREPHIVKYDVTKKERQKLDMHTDKSEWTFLIALSDGCGLDYEGGGTFFEALDATVHVQRGHALIFPGKLRHCGQRINKGLRFLLVGFLVDKDLAAQQQQQQQQVLSVSSEPAALQVSPVQVISISTVEN